MQRRYEISDEQWERIKEMFPRAKTGRPGKDSRLIFNAILSKSNTKEKWECDYHTYKERHLVECFFNKLKRFRRLGTRYDKLADSFINFIYLGCIIILLK